MSAIITLITDFGSKDGYVASLKGVILTINPTVTIVDVTHDIAPQNIFQAAFILQTVYTYFPENTIHLVVVDPEVGSDRHAVLLKTGTSFFIAPDNGVLSYIIDSSNDDIKIMPDKTISNSSKCAINDKFQALVINNPKYWRQTVSATFHGRDIFAPVAAHLSLGLDYRVFGEPAKYINRIHIPKSSVNDLGNVVGQIIHIDNFGNLITNITNQYITSEDLIVLVSGKKIKGLSRCYAEGRGLVAVIGSSGYVEISYYNGNAAHFLAAKVGDEIRIFAV